MRNLILFTDRIVTGLSLHLASALLAIISCLGLWQVTTRFLLSQPSIWTEEIMRRLLIWCVMLGVVVAIRQGALISVDLMMRKAQGTWRKVVRGIVCCANIGFLGTILWFGVSLSWRVRFQTFASVDLSMAWAYAAVPTGALLGILATLAFWIDEPRREDPLSDNPEILKVGPLANTLANPLRSPQGDPVDLMQSRSNHAHVR